MSLKRINHRLANMPVVAQQGFTLIELMITLLIGAILLTIAIPSYTDFIRNMRITAESQDFLQALQAARAEAVRTGADVVVSGTGGGGNEWGAGVLIERGALGSNDIVRELPAATVTIDSTSDVSIYVFSPNGFSDLAATDTVDVCDGRSGETGRAIQILPSGIIQMATQICP